MRKKWIGAFVLLMLCGAKGRDEAMTGLLEALPGRWSFEGSSMLADRSVTRRRGVVEIDRWNDGARDGLQQRWFLTPPFNVPDGGRTVHVFDRPSERWYSKFDPSYPALAWPPVTRVERRRGALVMPPSAHGDQTGDHLQRARYSDVTVDAWSWTLERSYNGGRDWFEIQSMKARRLSDAYLSIQARPASAEGGSVTTLLDRFDGSRGLATDPEGNLYIGARRHGSEREDVPIVKVRPDGTHSVFATGLVPVGLVWRDGFLHVYSEHTSPGRLVKIDGLGTVSLVADLSGSTLAADDAGTLYTVDPTSSDVLAIDSSGRTRVFASGPALQRLFSLAFDEARGVLFGSRFGSGEVYAIAGDGTTELVATVPGFGGANAAWIAVAGDLLYVTGFGAEQVFAVEIESGRVRLIAGSGLPGGANGPAGSATFRSPNGIAVGPEGRRLYVAELGDMKQGRYVNNRLRRIELSAFVEEASR